MARLLGVSGKIFSDILDQRFVQGMAVFSAGNEAAMSTFRDTVIKAVVFIGLVQAALFLLNMGYVGTASALGAVILLAASCHNELFRSLGIITRKAAGRCMRVVRSPVIKAITTGMILTGMLVVGLLAIRDRDGEPCAVETYPPPLTLPPLSGSTKLLTAYVALFLLVALLIARKASNLRLIATASKLCMNAVTVLSSPAARGSMLGMAFVIAYAAAFCAIRKNAAFSAI